MGQLRQLCSGYRRCIRFSGRATRTEFWTFWVVSAVVAAAGALGIGWLAEQQSTALPVVIGIGLTGSALWLPAYIAVSVRRLHDVGWSGWWLGLQGVLTFSHQVLVALGDRAAGTLHPNVEMAEIVLGASTGVLGVWLLVLHFLPGTEGEKRYGRQTG